MSSTPPGWYPDAQGTTRWFDGTNWTEHTQPSPAAPAAPMTPAQGVPSQGAPYGGGYPGTAGSGGYGGYGGAAGPGGYGGPQAPKKGKGLVIGLGVLGLVLVAGIIVAVVLLTTGSGSDSNKDNTAKDTGTTSQSDTPTPSASTSDPSLGGTTTTQADPGTTSGAAPEQVAQQWTQAIIDGDCKHATQYMIAAASSSDLCSNSTVPSGAGDTLKVKVGSATVTGSTATVPVKIVPDLPPGSGVDESSLPTLNVELEKQDDGSWLVSNATSS